ncbi:hypothetical protein WMY93_034338 [Mugilogobius chulae]|uniref:Uncharacterized protein n=1 Tax=Mugilogobius chulae TaxID=88201 RepID=A0AAW0MHH9_9GOBI
MVPDSYCVVPGLIILTCGAGKTQVGLIKPASRVPSTPEWAPYMPGRCCLCDGKVFDCLWQGPKESRIPLTYCPDLDEDPGIELTGSCRVTFCNLCFKRWSHIPGRNRIEPVVFLAYRTLKEKSSIDQDNDVCDGWNIPVVHYTKRWITFLPDAYDFPTLGSLACDELHRMYRPGKASTCGWTPPRVRRGATDWLTTGTKPPGCRDDWRVSTLETQVRVHTPKGEGDLRIHYELLRYPQDKRSLTVVRFWLPGSSDQTISTNTKVRVVPKNQSDKQRYNMDWQKQLQEYVINSGKGIHDEDAGHVQLAQKSTWLRRHLTRKSTKKPRKSRKDSKKTGQEWKRVRLLSQKMENLGPWSESDSDDPESSPYPDPVVPPPTGDS